MARTKQTAKNSTCGKAPRISLTIHGPAPLASAILPSIVQEQYSELVTNPGQSAGLHASGTRPCLEALRSILGRSDTSYNSNNDFCHMCADGGNLWKCDLCIRSECKKCIVVPPEHLAMVEHPDIKYLCLSCHLMDDMKTKTVMPFMAFFRNGKPVLTEPPVVHGRFELSPKSVIQAPVTAIIHLRLKTLPAKGPIDMLTNFLQPYFIHKDGILMKELPFDLGTEGKIKTYVKNATEIAKKILALHPSVTIFAISTHTDDDRGDLFAGQQGNSTVAAEIQEFFDVLLEPFNDVTPKAILYMLSCGRYIRHTDSRTSFTKAIAKHGFSSCIAFDARFFHPSIAWAFLVTVTEQVILKGHSLVDAVPVALGKSNDLNRHSGVYVLQRSPDLKMITTTRYLWSHRDYRPWGKDNPLQCPSCGAPQEKWERFTTPVGYRFKCRNTSCLGDDKRKGPYSFEVVKPKRVVMLPHGKTDISAWTRKHLRAVPAS